MNDLEAFDGFGDSRVSGGKAEAVPRSEVDEAGELDGGETV